MKITAHSLHWNNVDPRVVAAQKSVFDKFDFLINYTKGNYPHGAWMDNVCKNIEAPITNKYFPDSTA